MFGGNGVWLHTYVGGIDNAPGSIGYEHLLIRPPADLIKAVMTASDSRPLGSGAGAGYGTSSPPLTWTSGTKQTPHGEAALFWRVANGSLSLDVTVPANVKATTAVPLAGPSASITEGGGAKVWSGGKYVPGVEGVAHATAAGGAVAIEHGSGTYAFSVA